MTRCFHSVQYVILCAVLGFCMACTEYKSETVPERTYAELGPVVLTHLPVHEHDTVPGWGFLRSDGTVFLRGRFSRRPSAIINGYFTVADSAGSGTDLWAAFPEPHRIEGLGKLKSVGIMCGGLIPMTRPGGRIEIADGEGTVSMELRPIDGNEIVKCSRMFTGGLLGICIASGKWGAINTSGELVIEPVFDSEPVFSENLTVLSRTVDREADSLRSSASHTSHFIFNNRGREVFRFPKGWKPLTKVKRGRVLFSDSGGRISSLDIRGYRTGLNDVTGAVTDFDGDRVVWRDKRQGQYGLYGGVVNLDAKYENIQLADSGKILLHDADGLYSITDSAGNTCTRFHQFDEIKYLPAVFESISTPFEYICHGHAGYVLMNSHGHRLGGGPYEIVAVGSVCEAQGIESDFFNSHSVIHSILAPLNDHGWDRANIGVAAGKLLDGADSLRAKTDVVKFYDSKSGGVHITANAYSDRSVMKDSLESDGRKVWYADTAAHVKYIRVSGICGGDRFSELLSCAGAELVPKGFRAEKLADNYGIYVSNHLMVILTPTENSGGMYVYIMSKKNYGILGRRILSDIGVE